MKKSLLIALALTALCADVSTLPARADALYAIAEGSPKIHKSQPAAPSFDSELDRLHKAGLSADERKDYAEAVKYYRQAAERGYAKSQFSLAVCYSLGKGVAKDPAQAVYWLRQAAEQGYAQAQYGLGVCYDEGNGVTKDPVQAVYWQRQAAEQGVAHAQFNLGICYATGDGVAKDLTQAFYWFRQAAEQGVADAQLNVGVYYAQGKGVARDLGQAVYWLRQAAEQDHAQAQFSLGCLCCSESTNAATNIAEGKKWLQKAAARQDKGSQELAAVAKDILEEINDIETNIAEIQECKQLAQSYLSNNTIEDKELFDALNEFSTLADDCVADLLKELHDVPDLLFEVHLQNEEATKELNKRRQSRQSSRKHIINLIDLLKPDTTSENQSSR